MRHIHHEPDREVEEAIILVLAADADYAIRLCYYLWNISEVYT
jgi:hypothetical protein